MSGQARCPPGKPYIHRERGPERIVFVNGHFDYAGVLSIEVVCTQLRRWWITDDEVLSV